MDTLLKEIIIPGFLYDNIRVFHVLTGIIITAINPMYYMIFLFQIVYVVWVFSQRRSHHG